jgi:hypothetical protein
LQNISDNYNELLSVQEVRLQKVKVFPNPTRDRLAIELYDEDFTANIKVSIFNPYGQLMRSEALQDTSSIFELDVSDLQAGTYLIRVSNDKGGFVVKKFVKL